jgi:hypothetical protein
VDEFGKFLEYATHNQPEKELYFIQKIAEFANDENKNIILLYTLHQSFDVYGSSLESKQRNEWEKVKGRLKEITFNEPVEQLLYLASKKLESNNKTSIKNFTKLFNCISNSKIYPLKNQISQDLAKNLFPLDILSGAILSISLQKYGQNERSLFTFLETEKLNLIQTNSYYSLPFVYDYLINNFYSFLSSKYNPDYFKWSIIKNSLERAEIIFEDNLDLYSKVIKIIGLLNIFSNSGGKVDVKFINEYCEYALGFKIADKFLAELLAKKIIRYQQYSNSFVLFEGTDLDIDLALRDAETHVSLNIDIINSLKEYFEFPFESAKSEYIKKGTPRFFEYIISDQPIVIIPNGEIDGVINLIINDNIDIASLINTSKKIQNPILYAVFTNSAKIKETIIEIDKVNYVLSSTLEDRVVQRELKGLKEHLIVELNHQVLFSLYSQDSPVLWIFDGKKVNIKNQKSLNKKLSKICEEYYSGTPLMNNELFNRQRLPGTISSARKNLLKSLMENWDKEDLLYPIDKYPPDKTIYLSLLKFTGIHRKMKGEFVFGSPKEESFIALWDCCEQFINSCKSNKKSLRELIEILAHKPFKLKQGFIDFWIPIYMFIRRDDYALFEKDTYLPNLYLDLFDLIIRYPQDYFIKTFNVEGVKLDLFNKYRLFINKSINDKTTNQTFIETIRPFLSFYKSLPEYAKRTKRLNNSAIELREAISNAKDPEKTFFDDFPSALGYNSIKLYKSKEYLEDYILQLQTNIREIRTCYDELVNRIEIILLDLMEIMDKLFPVYKSIILQRYSSVKTYLMLPYQKIFYQRLSAPIEDKKAWLSSVVQALLGKNLESINDDEEEIIHQKMIAIFKEFDNLCDFGKLNIDIEKEEAFKYEITTLNESVKQGIIRISKVNYKTLISVKNKFRQELPFDRSQNIALLLELIKDQMKNE